MLCVKKKRRTAVKLRNLRMFFSQHLKYASLWLCLSDGAAVIAIASIHSAVMPRSFVLLSLPLKEDNSFAPGFIEGMWIHPCQFQMTLTSQGTKAKKWVEVRTEMRIRCIVFIQRSGVSVTDETEHYQIFPKTNCVDFCQHFIKILGGKYCFHIL